MAESAVDRCLCIYRNFTLTSAQSISYDCKCIVYINPMHQMTANAVNVTNVSMVIP